ncbi:MAG: hypothetical protein Q7R93_03940 [bacterium]|nr:hypothetical protein [bacterium]
MDTTLPTTELEVENVSICTKEEHAANEQRALEGEFLTLIVEALGGTAEEASCARREMEARMLLQTLARRLEQGDISARSIKELVRFERRHRPLIRKKSHWYGAFFPSGKIFMQSLHVETLRKKFPRGKRTAFICEVALVEDIMKVKPVGLLQKPRAT